MRKWIKYFPVKVSDQKLTQHESHSSSFSEHAKDMGGYSPDPHTYSSKTVFFDTWLKGHHQGRLLAYDAFVRKHLRADETILSVASGRCANELYLMDDGYGRITCSDLERAEMHDLAKKLFPDFRFVPLDIISAPPSQAYDAILALSLIYLFDDNDLSRFFQNVAAGLKPNGKLILDSAGSPDNWLSFFIHDVWLKGECFAIAYASRFWKRKYCCTVKEFGYRRTDADILRCAEQAGLELVAQENFAFLTEFKRSPLLGRIMRYLPFTEPLFARLGRMVPYQRMYCLQKTARAS